MDPPGNRKGTEGEKWHLTQEAGGFYPANFIQAYFIKRIQWVSVIFVMFYIKSPTPFFRHPPPRGSAGIASRSCTASSWRGRGDVCISALYPARETPPVFPLPHSTPPFPSLVVGPPQQQRLQPQHQSYLIAPGPSQSRQQELLRPGEKIHRIDTTTAEAQQLQ